MLMVNQLTGFGAGGRGQIQFVGGAEAQKAGATSGTSTIALNSGLTGGIASAVTDGDLVIAAFATGSASGADRTLSITDGTSNYTLIGSELYSNATNQASNLRIAYKFVSGDTATTFGPTGNIADGGAMAVYVFRGVDQSTPLDVAAQSATGTTNAANPPSITPSTAGAFIIAVGCGSARNPGEEFVAPGDLTDFFTICGADDNEISLGIGHKDDWTSGAFDPGVWTHDNPQSTSWSWAAMSIALRPA